jgi:glucose/arabinose dehydrogenase
MLLALGAGAALVPLPSAASIPEIRLKRIANVVGTTTDIQEAKDGSDRLFVSTKEGQIYIISGGVVLPDPFLDISDRIIHDSLRGLLGTVFHPGYVENGFFYVHYVDPDENDVIARFSVSGADPNRADPASEHLILSIPPPKPGFEHDGGQLQFGTVDGYLYISIGSNAPPFPDDTAQDLGDLHGKLLRIDVDGGDPYVIPPTNPFVDMPGARPEIWAYGLRNPFRFSFDRATGDLFTADVGNDDWEEVDFQPADSPGGENYGWWLMEGNHCFNPPQDCNDGTLTLPIAEYPHMDDPANCAVIGGYMYRGSSFPLLDGTYFYADQCSGRIWGATQQGDQFKIAQLLLSGIPMTSFGEDDDNLYVGSLSGTIYRVVDRRPFCDVEIDQPDYSNGETVTATVRRVVNFGDAPVPVRLRMAVDPPAGPVRLLVDVGKDGSFVLQPGTDKDSGPKDLFTVGPNMARGSYSLVCRLNDPDTGALLAEDRAFFQIQ